MTEMGYTNFQSLLICKSHRYKQKQLMHCYEQRKEVS